MICYNFQQAMKALEYKLEHDTIIILAMPCICYSKKSPPIFTQDILRKHSLGHNE